MSEHNFLFGAFAVSIGAICFGSMNVPVRRARGMRKDVIFVQWMMSVGSLVIGFVVNSVMGSPQIQLEVTAGGILWTIANLLAQFVLPNLGIAPTLLLYSTTNILTGWSTGRFGLFGLKQKQPKDNGMNIVGLVTILLGGMVFAFVKRGIGGGVRDRDQQQIESSAEDDTASIKTVETQCTIKSVASTGTIQIKIGGGGAPGEEEEPNRMIGKGQKGTKAKCMDWHKIFYISLSLIAGFFFSATAIPVLYIQDHLVQFPNARKSGLNYIFSHFMGVFLSATTIFVIYIIIRKNRPVLTPSVALPAMCGGALWACGMCSLFLANDLLSPTIAYPVLITVPCCVATLWSVLHFKDIQMNISNSLIIGCSFLLIFSGAIISFLSNL